MLTRQLLYSTETRITLKRKEVKGNFQHTKDLYPPKHLSEMFQHLTVTMT